MTFDIGPNLLTLAQGASTLVWAVVITLLVLKARSDSPGK